MYNRKTATTTIMALSQNHKGWLQEAVQQGVALGETVQIITESFDKIQFNKKLLMVFSHSLRNCMAEIPCCSAPNISVPSITTSSLVKVQKFLLKTINNDPIDFNDKDVEEIVKAAETLGINIVLVRKPSRNIKPHDVVELSDEPVTQQEVHDVVELPDEPVTQQEVHDVVELPDEPVTQQEVIDVDDEDDDDNGLPMQQVITAAASQSGLRCCQCGTICKGVPAFKEHFQQVCKRDGLSMQQAITAAASQSGLRCQCGTICKGVPALKKHFSQVCKVGQQASSKTSPVQATSSAPMREEEEEAASEDVAKMVGSSSESELLDGDGDISSDEESLQEESERMKNNDTEEESETEPASLMINDDGHKVNEDGELKFKCGLCGKDRKRPTPLKEHYSTTHFYKELCDKFVASNESHSLCR